LIATLVLAACATPTATPATATQAAPGATNTPEATKSALTATATPSIPIPTNTPTNTPTLTNTPSPTPTPTPIPFGGGLVRYFGFNLSEKQFYCGVMRSDGLILDQRFWALYDDPDKVSPPFYCPNDSMYHGMPEWSPDGEHYVYYYYLQGQAWSELYLGEATNNRVIKLGKFEESFSKQIYPPDIQWLGNKRLVYYDEQKKEVKVIDIDSLEETTLGNFDLDPWMDEPGMSPSPDGERIVVESWTSAEQLDFVLITIETGERVNITEEISSEYGVTFASRLSLRMRLSWSPTTRKWSSPDSPVIGSFGSSLGKMEIYCPP